jgi:hypothetical protein
VEGAVHSFFIISFGFGGVVVGVWVLVRVKPMGIKILSALARVAL